jgi:hypothetical protein
MIEGLQPRIIAPKPQRNQCDTNLLRNDRIKDLDRIAINSFMTAVNQKRFRHIYLENAYTRK